MTQSHGIKDGVIDEACQALQEQCFLWKLVGKDFKDLFTCTKNHKRNKTKKINR